MSIPNTTPTPNELYNGEMNKMNDTELRVVLVVTRATLGWIIDKKTGMRKEEDWISQKQLIEKTGRSNRAISTAIASCIKKEWIEARDKNGCLLLKPEERARRKIFYRLGKIFLDKISSGENTSQVKSGEVITKSGELNDINLVKKVHNTKEILTKETIQNISAAAPQGFPNIRKGNKEIVVLQEAVDYFKKSPQRHIQLIGDYAKVKKPDCQTGGQWYTFMKRNMRAATDLAEFSDKQIDLVANKIWGEKWMNKWSLETVLKFLVNNH